jgi:RNA polymerase sigma-70 factor (ECF subfamily)
MDPYANVNVTPRASKHLEPPAEGETSSIPIQISQGDHRGFDSFVNRHKNRLFAYIRYRVADRHRAEDLTQEVFLRAFRAMARGKSLAASGIAAWLFTIARNCVIEFLRSSGRRPLLLEADLTAGKPLPSRWPRSTETADPAEEVQRADERRRIEGLLAKLPEEQREVLALRVFGGLTVSEIAESTGCSLNTVKSRLRYGLLKIRRMIEPLSGDLS